jgi:hypothetical protein
MLTTPTSAESVAAGGLHIENGFAEMALWSSGIDLTTTRSHLINPDEARGLAVMGQPMLGK